MQVFQFQKTFTERLEEYLMILSWKDRHISASQVKTEWAYFVELQIEPTGWQAIWKIPRNTCEKLRIRYPTIVFGVVEQVNFRDLSCTYNITAVQDENVRLAERLEVALEDLWPTIIQENPEINIKQTADIVDRLRFFYSYVWMPWDNDNDDDFNWIEKHLQSRLQLSFDLREQKLNRPVASFVRSLIVEAKYIQQRRENIEEDIFDDDGDKKVVPKRRVMQLIQMHLRMTVIRSHIEILENPDMRAIYEEVKLKISQSAAELLLDRSEQKITDPSYYIVTLPNNLSNQAEILQNVGEVISENSLVFFNHALQNVLDISKPGDKIFLSAGDHMVHFVEYFFNSGQLSGIKSKNSNLEISARIYSPVSNSSLLMFDGDFILENLELDCQNILAGVVVKHGTLTIKNCKLVGNGKSSIQKGIICNSNASIFMENCCLQNFATGIILSNKTSLSLKDTTITNCHVGVEMPENSIVNCSKSNFINCNCCGIYVCGLLLEEIDDNVVLLNNLNDLEKYSNENLQVSRDCRFENCNNIIYIVNQKKKFCIT